MQVPSFEFQPGWSLEVEVDSGRPSNSILLNSSCAKLLTPFRFRSVSSSSATPLASAAAGPIDMLVRRVRAP